MKLLIEDDFVKYRILIRKCVVEVRVEGIDRGIECYRHELGCRRRNGASRW